MVQRKNSPDSHHAERDLAGATRRTTRGRSRQGSSSIRSWRATIPISSILKDGDDIIYDICFRHLTPIRASSSAFRDLVNWEPVGPALFKNVGSVWAPISSNIRVVTYLLSRDWTLSLELRGVGGQHSRPMERSDRLETQPIDRSCRRAGWQAVLVPERRKCRAAGGQWP